MNVCVKCEVSVSNISGVIDINVAELEQNGYQMCNIGHMIFIFKLDLAIVTVNVLDKNEDAVLASPRVITDVRISMSE